MKNKITTRRVLIVLCCITFLIILLSEGYGLSSPEYWILVTCYTSSMIMCFEEGIRFSEDSIKNLCGHSYMYLYHVYLRAKELVTSHKNALVTVDDNYEDELEREIMRIVNRYVLNISKAVILEEEDEENE